MPVRNRALDVILMVGLFLVGAAILWTLFTLGSDRERPPRAGEEPPPPAVTSPADGDAAGDVEVIPPGARTGQNGPVTGEDEGAEPTEPAVEVEAPDGEVAGDIIAGDPVPLERVGFSFTTGGAGACGITLEPWEHVAVSRELLAIYGCGTEVTLELADEVAGRSEVSLVVADTMNPQFTRTANIYVAPDEPATEYGITEGILRP